MPLRQAFIILMLAASGCDDRNASLPTQSLAAPAQSPAPIDPAPDPIASLPCVEHEDPNDRSNWYVDVAPAVELGPVRIGASETELRAALPDIGECRDPQFSMYCELGPSRGLYYETDQRRVISIHANREVAVSDLQLPLGLKFGAPMIETLEQLCKQGDLRWVVRETGSDIVLLSLALHAYADQRERFTVGLAFHEHTLAGVHLAEIEDYGPPP